MPILTTHILDTINGVPAADVHVRLFALQGNRELLTAAVTNSDGRTKDRMLDRDHIETSRFELEFDIGPYFARRGGTTHQPAFLDTVIIRFCLQSGISYHVPLLVSPWSYTTYRGS